MIFADRILGRDTGNLSLACRESLNEGQAEAGKSMTFDLIIAMTGQRIHLVFDLNASPLNGYQPIETSGCHVDSAPGPLRAISASMIKGRPSRVTAAARSMAALTWSGSVTLAPSMSKPLAILR